MQFRRSLPLEDKGTIFPFKLIEPKRDILGKKSKIAFYNIF